MRNIIIIAAVAKNGVIGNDNKLIWRLPEDLKRFKQLTQGSHIIMGRKTFESFPGKLPNRTHVIITRNEDYVSDDCIIVHSLEEAIKACPEDETIYIIGGGEIYEQSMELATAMELTIVDGEFEGDVSFPRINPEMWQIVGVQFNDADEKHAYDYQFITYVKK